MCVGKRRENKYICQLCKTVGRWGDHLDKKCLQNLPPKNLFTHFHKRWLHLAMATSFLLQNLAFLGRGPSEEEVHPRMTKCQRFMRRKSKSLNAHHNDSFFHRYIRENQVIVQCCPQHPHKEINYQVGVSMWQTLGLGETFGTFCQVTGTAGVVSYILVIFHLFIAPA